MRLLNWGQRNLGVRAWIQDQRDELISELAEQAGQQAATRFEPLLERVVQYAQWAAYFGIAGFVVGLLALIGLLLVIIGLL